MFIIRSFIFVVTLIAFNPIALADTVDQQLTRFLTNHIPYKMDSIVVNYPYKTPVLTCKKPLLSLTNEKKWWGNITLLAQCGTDKQFIHLNVAVTGHYLLTNRPIASGSRIGEDDLIYQSGRLDQLPDTIILNKKEVINQIASSNIARYQPIKKNMITKRWLVEVGQLNKVIIRGSGYQIVTSGKALANAALNESVHIRITGTGKIVNGHVIDAGIVVLNDN